MLPADVPPIVLGTARMGLPGPLGRLFRRDRKKAFAFLDGALDLGCRAIDTAASYQIGGTEQLLGEWCASRRARDRVFLVSKGCHPVPVFAPRRLTPAALAADLHASLRRLRTDRIDLYLFHRDDESAPVEPVLDAMATFQRQGKIGAWGVSNWTHQRIREITELARSRGLPAPAASSPHFSLLEWASPPWRGSVSLAGDAHAEGRAFYDRERLPVFAWSPLGGGFFSDRSGGARVAAAYRTGANAERLRRARLLAERRGVTPAQVGLAYLFSQSFPVHAVVATSSLRHLQSNLEATSMRLSARDVRWLESGDDDG